MEKSDLLEISNMEQQNDFLQRRCFQVLYLVLRIWRFNKNYLLRLEMFLFFVPVLPFFILRTLSKNQQNRENCIKFLLILISIRRSYFHLFQSIILNSCFTTTSTCEGTNNINEMKASLVSNF